MLPAKDAPDLASLSDGTIPVGPNTEGEIFYVQVGPLNPLSTCISVACIAFLIFLGFYLYPIIVRRICGVTSSDVPLSTQSSVRSILAKPGWLSSFSSSLTQEKHGQTDLPTSQLLSRRGLPVLQLARHESSFFGSFGKLSSLFPSPSPTATSSSLSSSFPRDYPSIRVHPAADEPKLSELTASMMPTTPAKVLITPIQLQTQSAKSRSPPKSMTSDDDVEAQR